MSAGFSSVQVSVLNFSELFESHPDPIAVDTYQRGFVWSDEKIRQLIDDLTDYQAVIDSKLPYYMGTVLVHVHGPKARRFIIDGQQRLTALCVLHNNLTGKIPTNCALTYAPKSARRIRAAQKLFEQNPGCVDASIFRKIVFTVLCVERVDLAFTFFDTQNNRGVPLQTTDLLKAYHLRAVDGEALQTLCAKRWEVIQQGSPVISRDLDFAACLFSKFLWRSRFWIGGRMTSGTHDALLDAFQKQTVRSQGYNDTIPLYRASHNRLGTALTFNPEGYCEIHANQIPIRPEPERMPFSIRQPIHEGIGFFLYTEKYAALLRALVVVNPPKSTEVLRFREVYDELMKANSLFLREIFLLASLMYVDQFDDERLWEFSLWLEHALGEIRLDKQQVRYEAAQNFFKKNGLNLLDIIAGAFRPEQVIAHLGTNHTASKTYANETIEAGKGVRGAYKQAVLAYYGRVTVTSLAGKEGWITSKLKEAAP